MIVKSLYKPQMEFLLSILLYTNTIHTKRFDLGGSWKKSIAQKLPEPIGDQLRQAETIETLKWLDRQISFLEGDEMGTSAEDLLAWLKQQTDLKKSLPVNDRVEYMPQISGEEFYKVLASWHEAYFASIDRAILQGLKKKKEEVDEWLEQDSPTEVIDRATNGIWLEDYPEDHSVYLAPQYHWRPIVLYTRFADAHYYAYAVDEIAADQKAMAPIMLRTQHALADENRLKILRFLVTGPQMFKTIHRFAGLAKSTVHHHLITLRAAGLVRLFVTPGEPDRYTFRQQGLTEMAGRLSEFIHDSAQL